MTIQSVQNEKVKGWVKLHKKKGRDETGQFLVEGEHLVREALDANCVDTLLIEEGFIHEFKCNSVVECSQSVMNKISQNISGTRCIAICYRSERIVKDMSRVIVLDNIQDPGNMGTIIRTAHSFNFDAVVYSANCVDIYNDKTIRSTQGALFHIPVLQRNLLEFCDELRGDGFSLFGTALENAIPFSSSENMNKVALVFGNEGQGISFAVLSKMDKNFKIEINDFDSLNVAIAAGICMYRYRK